MSARISAVEWAAIKTIIGLPEGQADAIRAVWPSTPEDSLRIGQALQRLARLISKDSEHHRATTFCALTPTQRENLLGRMKPANRFEALKELDALAEADCPLDVGEVLDEMSELLLRHLEDIP